MAKPESGVPDPPGTDGGGGAEPDAHGTVLRAGGAPPPTPQPSAATAETVVPGGSAATLARGSASATASDATILASATQASDAPDSRATLLRTHGPAAGAARGAPLVRIGPYEVLSKLGEGAMGVVYLARQTDLNRTVALKVMTAAGNQDELAHRFLREAQAAARLHHPGIVAVHEVGRDGDLHYYSMDYVLGQTLDELAKSQPISPRRALELVETIARTLAYAHAEGIIHRDLKPANILVTGDGRPLLADFGLARDLSRQSMLTQEGETLGTPAYMPPEQALGRVQEIDGRSDVYSLGAVLYDLLTGRPPFLGANPFQVIAAVVEEAPLPVRRLSPGVNRDIETICMKCLEKDRVRRYASAEALADDIRRFVDGLPIAARPPSFVGRVVRTGKRHAWRTAAVAAVVLIACGAIVAVRYRELVQGELAARRSAADELAARTTAAVSKGLSVAVDRSPKERQALVKQLRSNLDGALAASPGYRPARLARAELAAWAGEFDVAVRDLLVLREETPDDPEILYRIQGLDDVIASVRIVHEFPEFHTQAREGARRLQDSGHPRWATFSRIRLDLATGRIEDAVAAARGVLDSSEDPIERLQLAAAAGAVDPQAEPLRLIRMLDDWQRREPCNPQPLRMRSRLHADIDRAVEARSDLEECVHLMARPTLADLDDLVRAADSAHQGKDDSRLRATLEEVVAAHPDSAPAWATLAKLHRKAGRMDEAAAALQRSAALGRDSYWVAGEAYEAAFQAQGRDAAQAVLEAALRERPPADEVRREGGAVLDGPVSALIARKQFDVARRLVADLLPVAPQDRHLLELAGDVEFSAGRNEEALRWFDAALAAGGSVHSALVARRARVLRRLGKYADAAEGMKAAVRLSPTNRVFRAHLAGLLLSNGDLRGAMDQLVEVMYLTPLAEAEHTLEALMQGDFKRLLPGDREEEEEGATGPVDLDRRIAGSQVIAKLLPSLTGRLLKRGLAAQEERDFERAERCFAAAAVFQTSAPKPYLYIARLYAETRSWMGAILALERAADLGYDEFDRHLEQRWFQDLLVYPRVRRLVDRSAEKKK